MSPEPGPKPAPSTEELTLTLERLNALHKKLRTLELTHDNSIRNFTSCLPEISAFYDVPERNPAPSFGWTYREKYWTLVFINPRSRISTYLEDWCLGQKVLFLCTKHLLLPAIESTIAARLAEGQL